MPVFFSSTCFWPSLAVQHQLGFLNFTYGSSESSGSPIELCCCPRYAYWCTHIRTRLCGSNVRGAKYYAGVCNVQTVRKLNGCIQRCDRKKWLRQFPYLFIPWSSVYMYQIPFTFHRHPQVQLQPPSNGEQNTRWWSLQSKSKWFSNKTAYWYNNYTLKQNVHLCHSNMLWSHILPLHSKLFS